MGSFSSAPRIVAKETVIDQLQQQRKYQQLVTLFQQIKAGEFIDYATFKEFFLPESIPDQLGLRLYNVYSQDHSNRKLNLIDFLECYFIISDNNLGSLLTKGEIGSFYTQTVSYHIRLRADFFFYMFKPEKREGKLGQNEAFEVYRLQEINQLFFNINKTKMDAFYSKNNLSNDKEITKDQFKQLVVDNPEFKMFKWILEAAGTQKGIQNVSMQKKAAVQDTRSSSIQEDSKVLREFTVAERKVLETFFKTKLVSNQDLQESMQQLHLMLFQDIANDVPKIIKQKICEGFLYASKSKYFELESFIKTMHNLVIAGGQPQVYSDTILGYVFDIFTKYSGKQLEQGDLYQIFMIFADVPDIEKSINELKGVKALNRKDFIETMQKIGIKYTNFEILSTILNIEFGVRPSYPQKELSVIQSAMGGLLDPKAYISQNLEKLTQVYILNNDFWDTWTKYVGSQQSVDVGQSQGKSAAPLTIGNDFLKSNGSLKKDAEYLTDFVLVPKRVWKAFSSWYGKTSEFSRNVISYDGDGRPSQNKMTKIVGNKIYEVEMKEVQIKYGLVTENYKVFQNTQTHNAVFSRKTTLYNVLVYLAARFPNSNPATRAKKQLSEVSRLWIDQQHVKEPEFYQKTLEDLRFKSGQHLYIEFRMEKGQWPSDNHKIADIQTTKRQSMGCYNLGNTCYMNSGLQCIANAPYMQEFFTRKNLEDKDSALYNNQVNVNNPLGFDGEFATAFGDTMDALWEKDQYFSVWPKKFKKKLGVIKESFQGNAQHDGHEFLQTVLDSMHEEMNIRTKKPYIENPEDRVDNQELAQEFWCNYLRRNWSFFCFLMYGQMKQERKCTVCNAPPVIQYQPYSMLSLPVPNSNLIVVPIVIHLLPPELKLILEDIGHQSAEEFFEQDGLRSSDTSLLDKIKDMDHGMLKQNNQDRYVSVPCESPRLAKSRSTLMHTDFAQLKKIQTKRVERPILINISINQTATAQELHQKLKNTIEDLLISSQDEQSQLSSITMYYQVKRAQKHAITLLIDSSEKRLEEIGITDKTTLHVQEMLTTYSKDLLKGLENADEHTTLFNLHSLDENDAHEDVDLELAEEENKSQDDQVQIIDTTNLKKVDPQQILINTKEQSKENNSNKILISAFQYFSYQLKANGFAPKLNERQTVNEIFVVVQNRRLLSVGDKSDPIKRHLLKKVKSQFFAQPVLINIDTEVTGREVYELVWMRLRYMLKQSESKDNLWWRHKDAVQYILEQKQETRSRSPFVLKYVGQDQNTCSLCHWTSRCFGCTLLPTSNKKDLELLPQCDLHDSLKNLNRPQSLFEFLKHKNHGSLVCEWDSESIQQYYDQELCYLTQEHASVKLIKQELNQKIDLNDCLDLFQKGEYFEARCSPCKEERKCQTKASIANTPPVLILHFKRFRVTTNSVQKMQSMIHFPLYDLDLGPYLTFGADSQPEPAIYDLFGIVNHYGSLNGGHYIANIKNQKSQEWLKYDDNKVSTLLEHQVRSSAAYVLFYRRKDLAQKTMDQVIPRLNLTRFIGMPIRTKYGPVGYLLEYREGHACPYVVGLAQSGVMYLSEDAIIKEQNEIIPGQFKDRKNNKNKKEQDKEQKKCNIF